MPLGDPEIARLSPKREKIGPKVPVLRVVGSNPESGSSISARLTRTDMYLNKGISDLEPF